MFVLGQQQLRSLKLKVLMITRTAVDPGWEKVMGIGRAQRDQTVSATRELRSIVRGRNPQRCPRREGAAREAASGCATPSGVQGARELPEKQRLGAQHPVVSKVRGNCLRSSVWVRNPQRCPRREGAAREAASGCATPSGVQGARELPEKQRLGAQPPAVSKVRGSCLRSSVWVRNPQGCPRCEGAALEAASGCATPSGVQGARELPEKQRLGAQPPAVSKMRGSCLRSSVWVRNPQRCPRCEGAA